MDFGTPKTSRFRAGWKQLLSGMAVCALLAAADGCTRSPPEFPPNLQGRDPASVGREQQQAVADTLAQLFGTPDEPAIPAGVPLKLELLQVAAGPVGGDADGNQRGLYRRHCSSCHGTAGDGAGPAASILAPYPRDYREGVFKYTSTSDGAKPTHRDLEHTLRQGIAGTAMPSFAQLTAQEINALVEYVKYLSIRGQIELTLLQMIVDENEPTPLETPVVLSEAVRPAADSWLAPAAQSLAIRPPPKPWSDTPDALAASIARGRELYLSKRAQCAKCHGPDGTGNGEETELYDDWNKRKRGDSPQQTEKLARLFLLPLQSIRPRNFHQGVFHGGSTPQDLYWRICVGIKGTPMPAGGPSRSSAAALSADEIWSLVDYVRSLSVGPVLAVREFPSTK